MTLETRNRPIISTEVHLRRTQESIFDPARHFVETARRFSGAVIGTLMAYRDPICLCFINSKQPKRFVRPPTVNQTAQRSQPAYLDCQLIMCDRPAGVPGELFSMTVAQCGSHTLDVWVLQ